MNDVVIAGAVRSPIGRRGGGLSGCHSTELLGDVFLSLLDRTDVEPTEIDQVYTGCIAQVGMQSFNVSRTAWLTRGLPASVPAMTLDVQCGSSQQATTVGTMAIRSGLADAVIAGGVEVMSAVPMGSSLGSGLGKSIARSYRDHYEYTTQFEGAERIADKWGITREMTDQYGLRSQQRAAQAWTEGRFESQIVPISAPVRDAEGNRSDEIRIVERDECMRETTLEGLAGLKPVARPDGVHTAGTSSQIADAAAAVMLMSADKAASLGVTPRARIVDVVLVGTDPVLMLTGPIEATHSLLKRNGMSIKDFDVIENNEAFASVVLAWQEEFGADLDRLNPNGGAIALGHALGSTGAVLITKALHELERVDGTRALITMCCGGGLGTGTIIERI